MSNKLNHPVWPLSIVFCGLCFQSKTTQPEWTLPTERSLSGCTVSLGKGWTCTRFSRNSLTTSCSINIKVHILAYVLCVCYKKHPGEDTQHYSDSVRKANNEYSPLNQTQCDSSCDRVMMRNISSVLEFFLMIYTPSDHNTDTDTVSQSAQRKGRRHRPLSS